MTWLEVQAVAQLEGRSERSVQRDLQKGKYGDGSRCVNGLGKGGIHYEIALEFLPEDIQSRYRGAREEKDHSILLSLKDTQRDVVFSRQAVVMTYKEFKTMYPKADKLQAFLQNYNEQHPESPITKRQLNHWETLFKQDGIAGLVDNRGGYNKGQSSIPEDMKQVFLAYWLQEKGTKRGGPSIATCYRNVEQIFNGKQIPSISAFERLTQSIPLPTKILAREGTKAFNDKCMPHISFDYRSISTNQQWVADNHVFDVLVKFPDGHVGRPWIVGWLDRRSRNIVGYLMLETDPNADAILDAFARSVYACGIPESVLLDNGKDYTVHDLFNRNSTLSLVNEMTISVTNAIKYNAKAKPIERFFNTLEYSYCIHLPSYIGADPKRRPEKMKTVNEKLKDVAIDYEEFEVFISNVIAKYNNSPHSGDGMAGKTPCQAFKDFIVKPIRIADPIMLSMYFKRTTRILTVGRNGIRIPELELYFDADELFPYQGKHIYARYNTDDIRQVFCINEEGEFICMASSTALGSLNQELTAQNMRLLNNKKKQRRKMAREFIPDIGVPSIQQLAMQWGMSFEKPDLKLLPTMQTVNSSQQKQARAIKDAEEKQEEKRAEAEGGKSQREEDEAYYKFMIGGK